MLTETVITIEDGWLSATHIRRRVTLSRYGEECAQLIAVRHEQHPWDDRFEVHYTQSVPLSEEDRDTIERLLIINFDAFREVRFNNIIAEIIELPFPAHG